jgi:acyl-CoA dehydrogenase
MYVDLSASELELLTRCERLAGEELSAAAARGRPGHVNRDLVRALAEHGLLRSMFGEGHSIRAIDLCLVREGLARGSTEAETAFALQGLGAHPILTSATSAVRDHWIPRVAAGDAVAAFALTEPGAGSDAATLTLRAEPDGDGFRLHGEKTFISNAPEADIYTVFARTSEDGAAGVSAFAVPGDSPGLSGEPTPLLAEHPIGLLRFDGVPVSRDHLVGEIGRGFAVAMRTLDLFRPSVGACAVGMAQAALDAAVAHAAARPAFGTTLSRLQGVTHQLADAATALQAARLLVHAAARAYDLGVHPVSQASAMAKLFATETAQRVIDVAIQVHGARGLQEGSLLQHLYREVRGTRIYEGASEVQREIIARALFTG